LADTVDPSGQLDFVKGQAYTEYEGPWLKRQIEVFDNGTHLCSNSPEAGPIDAPWREWEKTPWSGRLPMLGYITREEFEAIWTQHCGGSL
jgi:hypothetical protein